MKVFKENDFRKLLQNKGFETNWAKHENENGCDIVAIKNGIAYFIEHKKATLRENGSYRLSGDIIGDIVVVSLPNGGWFFYFSEKTNFTKTCRLAQEVYND